MKARWRARVSASYCADGCSSASRQSRIRLKLLTALALRLNRQTDAPERLLCDCRPTCQSELKRTLRRGGLLPNTVHWRGFDAVIHRSFVRDGERLVSGCDK